MNWNAGCRYPTNSVEALKGTQSIHLIFTSSIKCLPLCSISNENIVIKIALKTRHITADDLLVKSQN